MSKVAVKIYGHNYTITGDRPDEEILRIASRVDEQMNQIGMASNYNSTNEIAVLAALNLSEACLEAEKEVEKLSGELKKAEADKNYYMDLLEKSKETASQEQDSSAKLQDEIKKLQDKVDEYETNFFDIQMQNIKLKNELSRLKGEI